MAASIPSHATPRMLEWARKAAGYSLEDISGAEKLDPKKIAAWEKGESTPSLSVLRRLAHRYKRPLIVFYLAEPPTEFSVVKDFRFLPASATREFSPELRFAIRSAQERQAWAAAFLEDSDAEKRDFVGAENTSSKVREVAAKLRRSLAITLAIQSQWQSDSAAFAAWKKAAEDMGIYVFQTSGVGVEEMRGFALAHDYAPVAVVNGSDSYTAKSFTLIHEIVHILLGVSAITGGRPSTAEPQEKIERFCNQVTAELLVPQDDFTARMPKNWKTDDDAIIAAAARRYRVSRAVIGLRLVETGFADTAYLNKKWPSLQSQQKPREGGPIPIHILTVARAGEAFSRLSLTAYYGGEIHGGQLSELLNMKLKHLPSLESKLYPNRVQSLLRAE